VRTRTPSHSDVEDNDGEYEPMVEWMASRGIARTESPKNVRPSRDWHPHGVASADLPRHLHRVYFIGSNSMSSQMQFPSFVPPELEHAVRKEKYEVRVCPAVVVEVDVDIDIDVDVDVDVDVDADVAVSVNVCDDACAWGLSCMYCSTDHIWGPSLPAWVCLHDCDFN
jgi:hypothetical protein